jgi:hypothetical protein
LIELGISREKMGVSKFEGSEDYIKNKFKHYFEEFVTQIALSKKCMKELQYESLDIGKI